MPKKIKITGTSCPTYLTLGREYDVVEERIGGEIVKILDDDGDFIEPLVGSWSTHFIGYDCKLEVITKVTEEKPASLELQKQELIKQIEQIDKQIADKKLEEQMKLGEKEVELKLTVNQLAWVVANVGTSNEGHTTHNMSEDYYLGEIEYKFKPPVDNQHGELYDKLGDVLKEQFE